MPPPSAELRSREVASAFELDLFGKNASLSRAAFETYLANSEAGESTRLTLIADIVTDWVAVVRAQQSGGGAADDGKRQTFAGRDA